ncbi:membrane fusion protein, multidrug efflux system [Dyella jiangningensis]|uniref:efflux RND transporter periplasmic adaptor subunit n=1 Tax=Dyella sp. AtDHG13 TaxID=1938897 RepID=UPI00087F86EB|nr:efflux RND transporter periplasmic adaptor subunit [Dyella sp. AtDHG13]PXV56903.1 multidrug efflux system membrane fusion protein [Dyella sp. AtDHG13]SDK60437.1 membrane fusion protein, multidrug efflux system [Dyella jiangningensis]
MNKRWILTAFALAVVGGSWALLGHSGDTHAQAGPPPAPAVTVAEVLVRPVDDADEFTGRLQAVDTIQLRPRVSGYVDSVHFKEGAIVRKGDLLFRIDPRPYQAEVDRLNANLAEAKANQVLAQANAERADRLLAQHAIAKEEADRQQTAAQSAKAQVASTTAALDAAKLNLGFTEIRAPIDGRVSNALVTPGNLVTSNDVLTSVVSIDPIYAYFDVDEHSYLKFDRQRREHGAAPQISMALADEKGFPHTGRVDFVDNQLRAGSGTIRLRAVFDNADASYTPGLYVRIQLRSDSRQPRALVDDRAIGADLGNKFVYVVDKDRKVEYRRVVTGPLLDGLRVVTEGLDAKDTVIVNGIQHVRPGVEVNPTKVAMQSRSLDPNKQVAMAGNGSGNKAAQQQ